MLLPVNPARSVLGPLLLEIELQLTPSTAVVLVTVYVVVLIPVVVMMAHQLDRNNIYTAGLLKQFLLYSS